MIAAAYLAGLLTLPILSTGVVAALIVWDRLPRRHRATWRVTDGQLRRFYARQR